VQQSNCRNLAWLATAALALASVPAFAEPAKVTQVTAADLGVMGISLKDVVKFNWGVQGALQGAGTPNQAGIGAFIPLQVGTNSVWFLDALANANFVDYSGYSSIGDTTVAGTTISTSTRLGYRWLNGNRSWMYGINAGYDSRPMATGGTDNGITVTDSRTVFFQQVAVNLEAQSNKFSASAYALVPVGEYGAGTGNIAVINSNYVADNLSTYGLDIGYSISRSFQLKLGGYYQLDEKDQYDLAGAQSFGLKTGLIYDITPELQAGIIYSYDDNFESRISGNLKWRFGGSSQDMKVKSLLTANPVIQALSATPENRDVRVANNPCAGLFDERGAFLGPRLNLDQRVGGSQIAGNLASGFLNLVGLFSHISAQNSQSCSDFRRAAQERGIQLRPPLRSPNLTQQDAEDRRRLQQARGIVEAAARQRAALARTAASFRRR
jgi:hypothetical protein